MQVRFLVFVLSAGLACLYLVREDLAKVLLMQESLEQLQEVEKLIEEVPSVPQLVPSVSSSIEDSVPLQELPQVDVPELVVPSPELKGL
jgi:hypothetical protein